MGTQQKPPPASTGQPKNAQIARPGESNASLVPPQIASGWAMDNLHGDIRRAHEYHEPMEYHHSIRNWNVSYNNIWNI